MVEEDPLHLEPEPLVLIETAGKILSSARIHHDLSVQDVAKTLNLSVNTINALEQDEYEHLPGYTFAKGYIRSYANFLGLDPDAIIATADLEPEGLSQIPTSRAARKLKSRAQGKSKKAGGLFFKTLFTIVLLAALVLFGLNQLSNLDMDKLAVFLKLPTAEKSGNLTENGNEIVFPRIGNSAENAGGESTGKKEALLRIE